MIENNKILFNTALACIEEEDYHKSISIFKKILADPDLPSELITKIKEQISYCYLSLGELENAWDLYENRESRIAYTEILKSYFKIPFWDGTENHSINLLVLAEEGIGDELIYSTFFNLLEDKVNKIYIECDRRLRHLYNRSYGKIIFFNRLDNNSLANVLPFCNYLVLIGDLPRYLNPTLQLDNRHFLRVAQYKSVSFKERLKEEYPDKILVGISYYSTGKYKEHRYPPKEFWDEIFAVSDKYVFINLQENKERAVSKRSFLYDCPDLHHVDGIDLYNDIDGLAALIDSMDFVISINNYISHIAGRINKLTILLLERMANCRLLLVTEDRRSLWYPNSIVIKKKNWDEINKELIEIISNKKNQF